MATKKTTIFNTEWKDRTKVEKSLITASFVALLIGGVIVGSRLARSIKEKAALKKYRQQLEQYAQQQEIYNQMYEQDPNNPNLPPPPQPPQVPQGINFKIEDKVNEVASLVVGYNFLYHPEEINDIASISRWTDQDLRDMSIYWDNMHRVAAGNMSLRKALEDEDAYLPFSPPYYSWTTHAYTPAITRLQNLNL
tara:strand:- start:1919 stop:2500 length:582 start_codon:yes stop_codon:yes gene_type:complete